MALHHEEKAREGGPCESYHRREAYYWRNSDKWWWDTLGFDPAEVTEWNYSDGFESKLQELFEEDWDDVEGCLATLKEQELQQQMEREERELFEELVNEPDIRELVATEGGPYEEIHEEWHSYCGSDSGWPDDELDFRVEVEGDVEQWEWGCYNGMEGFLQALREEDWDDVEGCLRTMKEQELREWFEVLVNEPDIQELMRAAYQEFLSEEDYKAWLDHRHEAALGVLYNWPRHCHEPKVVEGGEHNAGLGNPHTLRAYRDLHYGDKLVERVECLASEYGRLVKALDEGFLTFSDVDDAKSSDGEGDRLTQEVLAMVNDQIAQEEEARGADSASELSSVPSGVELSEVEGDSALDDEDDDLDSESPSHLAPSEIGDSMPCNVTVFRSFGIRASSATPRHVPTARRVSPSVVATAGSPPISRPFTPKPLGVETPPLSATAASVCAGNNSSPEPPISPSLSLLAVSEADQAFIEDIPRTTPVGRTKLVVPDSYADEEGLFTSEEDIPRTPAVGRTKLVVPDSYADEEGLLSSDDSDYEGSQELVLLECLLLTYTGDHEGAKESTMAAYKAAIKAGWKNRCEEEFSDPEERYWSPTARRIGGKLVYPGQGRPPQRAGPRRQMGRQSRSAAVESSPSDSSDSDSSSVASLGSEVSMIPGTPQERPVVGLLPTPPSPTLSDSVTHVSESTITTSRPRVEAHVEPRVAPPGRVHFALPDGHHDPSNPFYYPSPHRPQGKRPFTRRPKAVREAIRRRLGGGRSSSESGTEDSEEGSLPYPKRHAEEDSAGEDSEGDCLPSPLKRRRRNMDSDTGESELSEEEPQCAQVQEPTCIESDACADEVAPSTPIEHRYNVSQPLSVLAIEASKEHKKDRQSWRDEYPSSSAHPRLHSFLSSSKVGAGMPPPVPAPHTRPLPPLPPSPGSLPLSESPTPLWLAANLPQPHAPPPSRVPSVSPYEFPSGKATVLQPSGKATVLQQGSPVSQPHSSSCWPTPSHPQPPLTPRRRAYGQPVSAPNSEFFGSPSASFASGRLLRTAGDELKYLEWVAEGFVNADERDSRGDAPLVKMNGVRYNRVSDFPRGVTHDFLGMRAATRPEYSGPSSAPEALQLLGLVGPLGSRIAALLRFQIRALLCERGYPKKWESDNRTMTRAWEEVVMNMTHFDLFPDEVREVLINGPKDEYGAYWTQKRRCYVACIDVIVQSVAKSAKTSLDSALAAKKELEDVAVPGSLWYTGRRV